MGEEGSRGHRIQFLFRGYLGALLAYFSIMLLPSLLDGTFVDFGAVLPSRHGANMGPAWRKLQKRFIKNFLEQTAEQSRIAGGNCSIADCAEFGRIGQ